MNRKRKRDSNRQQRGRFQDTRPIDPARMVGPVRFVYGDQVIPSYATKEECEAKFPKELETPSNPEVFSKKQPMCQVVSTFVNWDQVKRFILNPPIDQFLPWEDKNRLPLDENVFETALNDQSHPLYSISRQIESRLDLPFHRAITAESTANTLKYLFFHMRCGIYIKISNNRLQIFAPFANKNYKNTWNDRLNLSQEDLNKYYAKKRNFYRKEFILPIDQWWANGNMICNELPTQVWGDHLVVQLRDFLLELCKTRVIADVECFINKRDFPHLKSNLTEPYDFIYDDHNVPLSSHKYDSYAPILSFFTSEQFADLPFPSSDDWEIATGDVFPPKGSDNYSKTKCEALQRPWEDKVNTAFFRGSATGAGVTVETNQRLKVAFLSQKFAKQPSTNHLNPIDKTAYLDAGITSWNLRDKKSFGRPMEFLELPKLGLSKAGFVPMYEQTKFKYILYIEGHCAAARYMFLMKMGFLILKVESSCVAKDLWFFPALEEWKDHVPVSKDLSDLEERIRWCKENDDQCKKIAEYAKAKYDSMFNRERVLDYGQFVLGAIGKRIHSQEKMTVEKKEPICLPKGCSIASEREVREVREFYEWLRQNFRGAAGSEIVTERNFREIRLGYGVAVLPQGQLFQMCLTNSGTFLKYPHSGKVLKLDNVEFRDKDNSSHKNVYALAYVEDRDPLIIIIADVLVINGDFMGQRQWTSRYEIAIDMFSNISSRGTKFELKFLRPFSLSMGREKLIAEISKRSYKCKGLIFNLTRKDGLGCPILEWIHEDEEYDSVCLPPPNFIHLNAFVYNAMTDQSRWMRNQPVHRLPSRVLFEHLERLVH